jgi:hypothetical protein
MPRREHFTYRSSLPLATAPSIVVETSGAREPARVQRGRTEHGRTVWRWSGGGVEPFAVEDEGDLQSFLVTRSDGAPFGRIRVRGWLRVRLEALDARAVQVVVQHDGRLRRPDGTEIGSLDLVGPNEVRVEMEPIGDPTRRALALATPVCQAANTSVLLG